MLVNKSASLSANTGQLATSGRWALMLVTSLFFMWGLSYGLLDVLNKHFQETLQDRKSVV